METSVQQYYEPDNLKENIKAALIRSGKDIDVLDPKELAIVDQLHTGGAPASRKLLEKADLKPGSRILDAGCGIGGTSRMAAGQFHCNVLGVDLIERFIEAAVFLTKCTGLEDKVRFEQGSILDINAEDDTFDAVICQHVLMNIKDKEAAVSEFSRVLKPGGKLVLHEITQGSVTDHFYYPVPWASESSISFLLPWELFADTLQSNGFKTKSFSDESQRSIILWEKVVEAGKKRPFSASALGSGLVFGEKAQFFAANMLKNLEENHMCIMESVQELS